MADLTPIPMGIPWDLWDPSLPHSHAHLYPAAVTPQHGAQGRLNEWAHWARAQGPRIYFLFEGPQLAVAK